MGGDALLHDTAFERLATQRRNADTGELPKLHAGYLAFGDGDAHLHLFHPDQPHHRCSGHHVLPHFHILPGYHPAERRIQPGVLQALPGDLFGRARLLQLALYFCPLHLGQAVVIVQLLHSGIGVFCLFQCRHGRCVAVLQGRVVYGSKQLSLPYALSGGHPDLRQGPADRKTECGACRFFHRT